MIPLMKFFSLRGLSVAVWIVFGLVLLAVENNKKIVILHTVLAAGITGLLTHAIKVLTEIPRPYDGYLCPADFTFPSMHASLAFSIAVIYAHHHPRLAWLAYAMALLISYSRIFLRCHYGIDVVIGGLLGFIVASLIVKIYRPDRLV
ncbi:hypothetical protein COU89_03480 [Candidatus Roizmanbacteria bacterium CG10_big_fil_rev_8_21_14_0_10_45_7]|uniref:Phosphatidic acid phosphatase type 2/haloperoxidase domain-containing protein n=1 Tax=Candidatus Roizmanbacteria bacterium CG10_big_fil_rev_8_21_14_0_10_45_7 TaxID=1974854 RepID=A0A2M8KTZ9_9BACT|nr:MAG: hypothetical protein COU89_03480 [Candidatus Roizmanbacteria bacterium CG10_big_fil_rev_8_21_14_0_10_45_7]